MKILSHPYGTCIHYLQSPRVGTRGYFLLSLCDFVGRLSKLITIKKMETVGLHSTFPRLPMR